MTNKDLYEPSSDIIKNSHANKAEYEKMYEESITSPEKFWEKHGKRIDWMKPYTKIRDVCYNKEDLHIRWYDDGTLNACLLYTSPSPRDLSTSRMPSSA